MLVFPASQGGLALPVPREILLQELESLFLQCTASPDFTASIISQWMRQDLRSLGAVTIAEAQLDLFLAHSPSARSASPWQLVLLLQYLAGSRVHWDEVREKAGAGNPISLLSLSFPARQRLGGEGIPDTADTPPEIARERRLLRVWRAQLQACLLADPRDGSTILLSTNSKARGPASDHQWVIDVDHFDSLLRDSAPFCEMLSSWSGRPAMHLHLALGRDRRPIVREDHCCVPPAWDPRDTTRASLTHLLRKPPPRRPIAAAREFPRSPAERAASGFGPINPIQLRDCS